MQLKELIKRLVKLEKKHGNLPVVAWNASLDLEMPFVDAYEDDNEDPVKRVMLSVSHN